jgi:type II secretory pathway pseudopilin PulG
MNLRGKAGFSYLTVMALIVIIGISLTAVGYQWKTMAKREKEKELLFRGNEIRSAIIQYVNADPLKRYPHSVEDLIKDPKSPKTVRYLRKLYKDPVTNDDWEIITDPARGIVGVHSKSGEKPLKTSNFRIQDRCFEGKEHYRDWLFIAQAPILAPLIPPAGGIPPEGAKVVPVLSLPPCPPTTDSGAEEKK